MQHLSIWPDDFYPIILELIMTCRDHNSSRLARKFFEINLHEQTQPMDYKRQSITSHSETRGSILDPLKLNSLVKLYLLSQQHFVFF